MFGDREVEIKWLLNNLIPGNILDVGASESIYIWDLIRLGYIVTLNDVRAIPNAYPDMYTFYIVGDIRNCKIPGLFNNITCISTLEHIGLKAYNQKREPDPLKSQINAVKSMGKLLSKGGRLLISIPYGKFFDGGWYFTYDPKMIDYLLSELTNPLEDGTILEPVSIRYITLFDPDRDIYNECDRNSCSMKGLVYYKGNLRSNALVLLHLEHIVKS